MFFKEATSGRTALVWYLLSMFAVFCGYVIGQMPLLLVQIYQVEADQSIGTAEVEEFQQTLDFTLLNIDKNVGFMLMITIFIFAMLAFMLAVKYFHQRPLKNVITPHPRIDYSKILFAFGFWFMLALVFEGVNALIYPDTYYMSFKPLSWIVLLLICIFMLPIQTTLEEFVLRGYIMPAIGLIFNNKWVPLLVSSIIFGIIHGMNPEVEKFGFWTMQVYYVGAGLFLGLITILDDSLELAIGVHAATNIFGAAFFSFEGSVLQTDSLVKATEIDPNVMITIFMISAVIFVIVCNKKYNWNGFSRLFEPAFTDNEKKLSNLD